MAKILTLNLEFKNAKPAGPSFRFRRFRLIALVPILNHQPRIRASTYVHEKIPPGMPIANPTLENIGSEPQIDSRVQVADHSVVDVAVASSGCCCWANEDPSSPRTFAWAHGQTLSANVVLLKPKKNDGDEGESKNGPIE